MVTGALTWTIGLAGSGKSGRVMTWNGIAMYAGIALGAPLAIYLSRITGTESGFIAIIILSGLSLLVRIPFYKVIGKVSGPGMRLAFSSIGFACISSFVALFFAQKNWGDASFAFMWFGGSYVLVRLLFSSYPDKYGAHKVALISLPIEVIGQLCLGFSNSKIMAIVGCSLSGAGFSLIFPALGVLVINKVKPQMRGTALGAYSAFFDLSLGVAAPIAGFVASWSNYQSIYLFGGLSSIIAIIILMSEKRKTALTADTVKEPALK